MTIKPNAPITGEAINQISKIVEEYYPERFAADPPPPTKREMRPQKSPLAWMETVGGLVALFPSSYLPFATRMPTWTFEVVPKDDVAPQILTESEVKEIPCGALFVDDIGTVWRVYDEGRWNALYVADFHDVAPALNLPATVVWIPPAVDPAAATQPKEQCECGSACCTWCPTHGDTGYKPPVYGIDVPSNEEDR